MRLNLLENAMDSLSEAIDYYVNGKTYADERCYKFCVIMLYHSAELILKEILVREHKTLIYEQIDDYKNGKGTKTIADENEKWVFISHDDWDESDAFVNLIKVIQSDCNGKIINIGDVQYKIEGSKLDLIYQWDSCFGSVVIYNKKEQKESVVEFLQSYFIQINM